MGMPIILTSGFCNISWSKRNSTRELNVHSNIIRVGIGVNMDVHGSAIDHWSEGVPVMSIIHRTYRVTCLRVIDLLSTRWLGAWEKVTRKFLKTLKIFRRETRKCFGVTEKVSEKTTRTIKTEKFQNASGNFWRGSKRFRDLPEIFRKAPRSCTQKGQSVGRGSPLGDSPSFLWVMLVGAPPLGGNPLLWAGVGGGLLLWEAPPLMWQVLGGGPLWGSPLMPCGIGEGGPLRASPPFCVIMLVGAFLGCLLPCQTFPYPSINRGEASHFSTHKFHTWAHTFRHAMICLFSLSLSTI